MSEHSGARHLPEVLGRRAQEQLLADLRQALVEAPLYTPAMPRTGRPLSVRTSNCGVLGWVTDKDGGYRYQAVHPVTGRPWPAMPPLLIELWRDLTGYPALPEACLVNYYAGDARLGSHRDEDERDRAAPVLSISLGDDAVFHVGGLRRDDRKVRYTLKSGDGFVLGGRSRMAYHGIDRIVPGTSDLLAEGGRINLTLRRVAPPRR